MKEQEPKNNPTSSKTKMIGYGIGSFGFYLTGGLLYQDNYKVGLVSVFVGGVCSGTALRHYEKFKQSKSNRK